MAGGDMELSPSINKPTKVRVERVGEGLDEGGWLTCCRGRLGVLSKSFHLLAALPMV